MADSHLGTRNSTVLATRVPVRAARFVRKCSEERGISPGEFIRFLITAAVARPQLVRDVYTIAGLSRNATPDEALQHMNQLISELEGS
jgi:hypothetical protein